MANENKCVRCGKPCAPGEVMCAACSQWLEYGGASTEAAKKPVPGENSKTCIHCGGTIPKVAQFCPNCGRGQKTPAEPKAAAVPVAAKAVQATPAQKQSTAKKAESKQKEKKNGSSATVVILLVVVLLLIAALIAVFVVGVLGVGKDNQPPVDGEDSNLGIFEAGDGIITPEKPEDLPVADPDAGKTLEPETEPEEEEPAVIACRNCGVAITVDLTVCPYCEWDQSMDPADVVDEPLSVTLGTSTALDGYSALPVKNTSETSMVSQSGNHDNSAAATVDGDLATSWQEGANGYGIGQSVSYFFDGEQKVAGMKLWLGNWREGNWYAENGVPKLINIYIGDTVLTVEFPHRQECFYVIFNQPVPTELVMLEISSAHPGSKYEDTCIAEVQFFCEPEA